jgi:hypothetical protein
MSASVIPSTSDGIEIIIKDTCNPQMCSLTQINFKNSFWFVEFVSELIASVEVGQFASWRMEDGREILRIDHSFMSAKFISDIYSTLLLFLLHPLVFLHSKQPSNLQAMQTCNSKSLSELQLWQYIYIYTHTHTHTHTHTYIYIYIYIYTSRTSKFRRRN